MFNKLLIFLLFSVSLNAQVIKPDLTKDWSTSSLLKTHEISTAGTVIKLDGTQYEEGSLNKFLKEGVNYYLIYDNKGSKELIYAPELVPLSKWGSQHLRSSNYEIAATHGSLINAVFAKNGRTAIDPGVYAAGRIIVTNGKISFIDNHSLYLKGGRDKEHLDFAVSALKEAGLKQEKNTKLMDYEFGQNYGHDISLQRCSSQLKLMNDPEKNKYLTKMTSLYAELAEKYPDKEVPGYVDVYALSDMKLEALSEFFSLVQDNLAAGISLTTASYYANKTELDNIISQGEELLANTSAVGTKENPRKNVVSNIFKQAEENFGQTPLAVLNILSNEKIVPKRGVVLSLGAGKNFYEWIVPLLSRKDIAVVVIEKPDQEMESSKQGGALCYRGILSRPDDVIPAFAETAWKEIEKNNPELISNGKIKSKDDLVAAIKKQVVFYSAYDYIDGMRDVKADLVISRLPWHYELYGALRKNGFAWVVTERNLVEGPSKDKFAFSTKGYDVVKMPETDVSNLLPSNIVGSSVQNRFLAFEETSAKPYLFFPKNENESKYSGLYISRFPTIKATQGEYASYGSIFKETDGDIKLPEMPDGGKVLYVIYEGEDGVIKVAYSNEIPNLDVNLNDPNAEILVTHRSLYKMLRAPENVKGFLGSGEIVVMPNGEISLFTNRSNTFKGGKEQLDFAFNFFKEHGVKFSDKVTLDDYSEEGKKPKEHYSSMEKAKLLVKVAQNKEMYEYYKLLINTQREMADLVGNKDEPGRFLSEAFLKKFQNNDNYAMLKKTLDGSSVVGFWSYIESELVIGEGVAGLVYKWMEHGPQQPTEQITKIREYMAHEKSKRTVVNTKPLAPNRTETEYYITGQKKSEMQYENNELVLKNKFYISGNKELSVVYKAGVPHGSYYKYYDKLVPDGKSTMLSESGFYNKGKRCGAYYLFYEDGGKKSVLLYSPTGQLLSTSDFYEKTGKIYQYFLYNSDSKLISIEEYYPSGYKKYTVDFETPDQQSIVAVAYENSYEKKVKSTQTIIGTNLVAVLELMKTASVIGPMWAGEKIDKIESIMYSSEAPTNAEIKEVFDYANYLISSTTDLNKLETVTNWLYKTYDGFSMDTKLLLPLSRSVVALKSESEPSFLVDDQIDYKDLSNRLRKYVTFKAKNADCKDFKSDVAFLFPFALQQLADNINARFTKGIQDPKELVTQEECNTFTLVLTLMANDVYNAVNADIKITDSKMIPARLLALKDLSAILKIRSAFSSDTYFWGYARASYLIDEAVVKAESEGFVTKEMLDVYNKEVDDLKFRSERLRSGSRAF